MFGREKYSQINKMLNKKFQEKSVLVAAHRGAVGGNIIENTLPSFRLALNMGADLFETDLVKSADGILYCYNDKEHNPAEKGDLKQMSSMEIDHYQRYNRIGLPSAYKTERFESVLSAFTSNELFNVDRAWRYFPEVAHIFKKYPYIIRQAVLKSHVEDEPLEFLNNLPEKYMYMAIVKSWQDIERVLAYENINLVGFEVIIPDSNSTLFQDETIEKIHSMGFFTWINSITLSSLPEHSYSAGFDDNNSIMTTPENGWGFLIKKGFDVIQTDWPMLVSQYRDSTLRAV